MARSPRPKTILCERISDDAVLLSYNVPKYANDFAPQQYTDLTDESIWARNEPDVKILVM
jgi:hypothetical protein